jgi:ubiquinone/menaquinone biosynthesis C-methylase UbiE
MSEKQDFKFWKIRAENYNKLEWAREDKYLKTFIRMGEFQKRDIVLDVGTGTGIVAHAVAPLVEEIIGLDKSQEMMEHSNWNDNKYFIKRDIRDPFFNEGVFDVVTARMVFHHILENTQGAMNECYRIVKKGGRMVFSEGVPPSKEVREDYIEIFRLKEERLTFYEDDLIALMKGAGFENISLKTIVLPQMSVRNWLDNSGLSQSIKDQIFKLHVESRDYFKKAYSMTITDDDCFINMKMVVVVGEKR